MNKAFPEANVENYQSLIKDLKLPDANDRHVLATAIKSKAELIFAKVTLLSPRTFVKL